ncbi:16S rRNA (uracil1498-N3)-methyltransferase [Spiroplasma helicoides]|uniref:Ribosomal RNA small subunit methyltransferase E n=1 Tax=Spiroplasma helicoides TaxID=216938 RepID=A0A1B3SK34_9MOLU|nr:RsmE family RNA methyltransferase [Spiroplasma helicoides]AOG60293.1 16S rRNA (uracil1498-N3)-methyltransferase [Spiroplasma helicoides]
MHSFFVSKKIDDNFLIEDKDLHHIKNVIKLSVGEKIYCIYENEKYNCEIKEFLDQVCSAKILNKTEANKSLIEINLIAGIIREQKWDYILQKATELGVTKIIPVQFKRNVVVIEDKKREIKKKRWQEICETASKQSKRTVIPQVLDIIKNIEDLKNIKADLNLVAWEENCENNLKSFLQKEYKSVNIVIGPEGGLEKKEVDFLESIGYKCISLGSNILRAETASLFLISAIMYEKN